jgi:hypothetical protein
VSGCDARDSTDADVAYLITKSNVITNL